MSFSYPEVKMPKGEGDTATDNNWDKRCASYEILAENVKHPKGKKPLQSPININTKNVQECNTLCNLSINYKPSECRVDKYGDNLIRILLDDGNFIKYGENNYELKYIFFHTPSNHIIDGKSAHMEINFYHGLMEEMDVKRVEELRNIKIQTKHNHNHYHANTDGNEASDVGGRQKGVVLSVLVDVGSNEEDNETRATKPNIFLSQFIHTDAFRDVRQNEDPVTIEVSKNWNVEQLLPDKRSFYTYNGSIAMPPCIEKYAWVIFDQPIKIIEEYLQLFRKIGNPKGNRQTHPLNGRLIFFNPNVKMEEKPDEKDDKNKYVEKKLSPIRIVYDNRAGSEYRARADYVISKYSGGPYTGWQTDGTKLAGITKEWDETSKIGYSDIMVEDIVSQASENPTIYNDLIFDYYLYSEMDYLDYFLDILGLKDIPTDAVKSPYNTFKDDFNAEEKNSRIINLLNVDANICRQGLNRSSEYSNEIDIINTNLSNSSNIFTFLNSNYESEVSLDGSDDNKINQTNIDNFVGLFTTLLSATPSNKSLFYFLITWNKKDYKEVTSLMDSVERGIQTQPNLLKRNFFWHLINEFNKPEAESKGGPYIIFKKKSSELTKTIDGDTCQEWGSNSTHYEGNLLKFWKKPVSIHKEGHEFDKMNMELKEAAKNGLMTYEGDKFKRHNKCRNPNNAEGAPWCYTTNPKVRWQYCALPDDSTKHRNYVMIGVFFMLILLAVFLVKLIFRNEWFSKLVSTLTGGTLMSKAVFSANQVASNVKANAAGPTQTTMAAGVKSAAKMI